jgi:hypothetical protein
VSVHHATIMLCCMLSPFMWASHYITLPEELSLRSLSGGKFIPHNIIHYKDMKWSVLNSPTSGEWGLLSP